MRTVPYAVSPSWRLRNFSKYTHTHTHTYVNGRSEMLRPVKKFFSVAEEENALLHVLPGRPGRQCEAYSKNLPKKSALSPEQPDPEQ